MKYMAVIYLPSVGHRTLALVSTNENDAWDEARARCTPGERVQEMKTVNGFGVLRPSLTNSDEALVLSVHDSLAEAMEEQTRQAKLYGWAYCEARALKAPAATGTFISRSTHEFRSSL